MFRASALSFCFSAAAIFCQPAYAADLIEGYQQRPPVRHVVHRQHKTYVRQVVMVCDQLIVDYRRPYEPHTEIVNLCDRKGYVAHHHNGHGAAEVIRIRGKQYY